MFSKVRRDFVEEMLNGYGLPPKFIQLVMVHVTTTKFSVKVSGDTHDYFEGKRGLRQGDPISPLLFALVMEYLSRTTTQMCKLTDFRFHPMCKGQQLTLLIFANDLMIFHKGNVVSVQSFVEALQHFSNTTGLVA